jgi:hypothetical protein
MSDRDLRVACISKTDSAFKADGKDDTYVAARFDWLLERVSTPAPKGAHAVVAAALGNTPETARVDATDEAQKEAKDIEAKALKAWERN